MKPKVLLGDGWNRVTLAIVRALGRAGIHTDVFEYRNRVRKYGTPPSFRSRWCSASYLTPDPRQRTEHFLDTLQELLSEYDVYVPVSTNAMYLASRNRDRLERSSCSIPAIDPETLDLANNTFRLISHLKDTNVRAPRTRKSSLKNVTKRTVPEAWYPIVVKLTSDEGLELPPEDRYRIVREPKGLPDATQFFSRHVSEVILQEYIPGNGYGFSTVVGKQGGFLGAVCHRRLREYPPEGGPSAFCTTVREPDLVEQGKEVLKKLNWFGPAQVEFRRHKDTGEFYLMEVNPRFWGSLPLALAAGLNLPGRFIENVLHQEPTPEQTTRNEVKLRFLHLDAASTILSMIRDSGTQNGSGSLLRSWLDPSVHYGLLSLDDPLPSFGYYISLLRDLVSN